MPQQPLKRLNTATANELAELILLQHDIGSCLNAMKLWSERFANRDSMSQEEQTIAQSLFRDAIVQFIGCFDRTAKYRLFPDDVYQDIDGGIEYYNWLKDIRDAYAAHKFGPLRQCVVGVFLDTTGTKALTVGDLVHIYMGPADNGGPMIFNFIRIASRHLDEKIEKLQKEMLLEVQGMSPEALSALPNARTHGVDPGDVRQSRAEFDRSVSGTPSDTKRDR